MSEQEIIAYLRLQKTPFVGDITAKKLIAHFGSAQAIFKNTGFFEQIDGIGKKIKQELCDNTYQKQAEQEWDFILKNNIQFCSFDQDEYPFHLKQCIDGPILLFYKGNLNALHQRCISIVGTRNITSYGNDTCQQLIKDLSQWSPVIVSGLAYGVDIVAHKEAIKNGLQTVACLAHGLHMTYPKAHQKYIAEIVENGVCITDFGFLSKFDRKNFLRRNRIIAGLSQATVVIESAQKGGSLVTADIAFSYNREVFAVPGRITDMYSSGCNNLIKSEKAHILTCAEDIIKCLNWDIDSPPIISTSTPSKKVTPELSEKENLVYQYLHLNGKQLIDIISIECNIPIQELSVLLFQLEMKNCIRPLPGKIFEVI